MMGVNMTMTMRPLTTTTGTQFDISMAIEADADNPEAMAAITIVDFDPGHTLGKLMAFVNQLRMSSELI